MPGCQECHLQQTWGHRVWGWDQGENRFSLHPDTMTLLVIHLQHSDCKKPRHFNIIHSHIPLNDMTKLLDQHELLKPAAPAVKTAQFPQKRIRIGKNINLSIHWQSSQTCSSELWKYYQEEEEKNPHLTLAHERTGENKCIPGPLDISHDCGDRWKAY